MTSSDTLARAGSFQHGPRHGLGEEERPAQIDRDRPVEALGRELQQVTALERRDAGVVHQAIDLAQVAADAIDQRPMLVDPGDVVLDIDEPVR